jgi:WD40 repeat protein
MTLGGRQVHTLTGHSGSVLCVNFFPNGNRVASGSIDRFVKIWDVATGALVSSFVGLR